MLNSKPQIMRLFITLTLLLNFVSALCFGQTQVTLPQSVKSLNEIIPDQWVLIESTLGDLNQDGLQDVAVVIQSTDTANIEMYHGAGGWVDSTNYNPRVLAIYVGKKGAGYEKKWVNEDFLLTQESGMVEPLGDFTINEGQLSIWLDIFYSMGSWMTSNHHYVFAFHGSELVLVSYSSNELDRSSGAMLNCNIDFTAQEIEIREGNISQDEDQDVVTIKHFELAKLLTLDSMGVATNTSFEGVCWL